jgi:hypothetical protein
MTTNAVFWIVVALLVVGIVGGAIVGRILAREAEHHPMVEDAHDDGWSWPAVRTCPRVVGPTDEGRRVKLCGRPMPCPVHRPKVAA